MMDIDYKQLKRDYTQYPLKRGEQLSEEELRYLFIDLNLSTAQIGKFLEKSVETIRKWTVQYNLKKDIHKIRESAKKTYKEKTGYENAMQNPEILKQREQDCLYRTGYKHPMQNHDVYCNFRENNPMKTEEGLNSFKETNLQKFGSEFYMGTEEFKQKSKETLLNTVGCDNPMKCEKYKMKMYKTNLEKYGYTSAAKSEEVKEKTANTCKERYNIENPQQDDIIHEKTLNTRIEKYGDTKLFGTDSFKLESVKTCIEKYGYPTASKSQEVKEKTKQHNLEKYGMEWPLPAIYETKHKNNSFHISNIENKLYEMLLHIFPNTKSQYMEHPIYRFACDFYIPEIDLLIEYNGTWTHGKHPFDENNEEDLNKLTIWKEKAKNSNYYKNAIYTWTDLDVRKQRIAKENNLNYLVFYNKKEFMEWFNNLT